MNDEQRGAGHADEARAALAETAASLRASGIAPEPLAVLDAERRVLGLFRRPERLRRVGDAWRLGALLVTPAGDLIVGATTARSKRPERVGYVAESARARDALRHAAFRGSIAEGETVHVGGTVVDLAIVAASASDTARMDAATGESAATVPAASTQVRNDAAAFEPIVARDNGLAVRLAPSAPTRDAVPIAAYLAERAERRIRPPRGT